MDSLKVSLAPRLSSTCSRSGTPQGGFIQEMLRRTVTSVPWSVVVLVAALTDVCLCVVAVEEPTGGFAVLLLSDVQCTALILAVYSLDVILKIYVFTLPIYLRKLGNIVDSAITVLSIMFTLLETSIAMTNGIVALRSPRIARLFFRLMRMGHCFRGVRFAKVAVWESVAGARRAVGCNKRRFVDAEFDFDLDLAYITPRLIAMSVPARSCLMGMYRNPIMEVVRFFETFHKNNYLIVNCCPELPYPAEYFKTGRVVRFDIQDHTPPTMAQTVEFLKIAREWMRDPEHVMAVHCRGGKGRTGSLCSAWMIYNRDVSTGSEACNNFALARTDSLFPHHKQTVDTPSQVRYLEHVGSMLEAQSAFNPKEVALPQRQPLRPLRFTLEKWFLVPVDDELLVAVHEQREGGSGRVRHWSPQFRHDTTGSACVDLGMPDNVTLQGDVRISVFAQKKLKQARARSRDGRAFPGDLPDAAVSSEPAPSDARVIAGKEPGCLFYFMFHTSFIGNSGRLAVPLNGMDKAGKGKHKSRYFPQGLATLDYVILPSRATLDYAILP